MRIEVKATTRSVKHVDRFGNPGNRIQPTIELVVDGIPFYHDCSDMETARKVAYDLSVRFGL